MPLIQVPSGAGARTGLGEKALLPVRRLTAALGVEDTSLPAIELFTSLSARLTPDVAPERHGLVPRCRHGVVSSGSAEPVTHSAGNLAVIEGFEKLHQRQLQELRIREQMLSAGAFTPSAYFQVLQRLGQVFE